MDLKILGAGLPRTGTMSLKRAIEQLTGGRCYHMHDVSLHPHHAGLWVRVLGGEVELMDEILDGYCGAVDWPVSALWREASARYPAAWVFLTRRAAADDWWRSVDQTVWQVLRTRRLTQTGTAQQAQDFWDMHERLLARFCAEWDDQAAACGAYERHLARVRTGVAPDRLVDFPVGAGWAPLCEVLRCALPDVPFPVHNTREAFQKRMET